MSMETLPALSQYLMDAGGSGGRLLAIEAARDWVPGILGGFTPLLLADNRLYCIDGANSFDPHAFAIQARRHGVDPSVVLDRVLVTRAFTIHQLQAVVSEMLPPLVSATPRAVVAVLGVEQLFLEESLPMMERRRVLREVIEHLQDLRVMGLQAVLTYQPPRPGADWWLGLLPRRDLAVAGETRPVPRRGRRP